MNGLQVFVGLVFTAGNIWLFGREYALRYPAPKSRREQIARIRSEERASRIR